MERERIEALAQIIIIHAGADDEVAHSLSKMLDYDNAQRATLAEKEREIAKTKEDVRRFERDWLEATDQVLKLQADLDQASNALRKRLWLAHGAKRLHLLYGDDGRLDCNTCMRDYKTTSVDELFRWEIEDGAEYMTTLDQVVGKVVQFASAIAQDMVWQADRNDAKEVLTSAIVQSWKARQQEGKG